MLNFNFPEKGPGLVCPTYFVNNFREECFSYDILLSDQILLSYCLYFSRYWTICVLQLFVKQAVSSQNLKLTLLSNLVVLLHDQEVKTKI